MVEREPNVRISVELTHGEAQVLLVRLERMEPTLLNDAGPFREDSRLFKQGFGKLRAALEQELAKTGRQESRKKKPAPRR